jgi:methyltransferase
MLFIYFFTLLVIQRAFELVIARRNEKWMKSKGAIEVGGKHYPIMVLMHGAFLILLLIEVLVLKKEISPLWPIVLTCFLFTQIIRVWSLASLGKYWNTKIIILPNTNIVKKGPYKYLRHPNYTIVVLEILLIPLLFQAYWTAAIFSILNIFMLSIRIPLEEKALMTETNYKEQFETISRFSPLKLKK